MQEIFKQTANDMVILCVRTLGFLLLIAGLWVVLQVLSTAQDLYEEPDNIARFAIAIQKGSNVDNAFQLLDENLGNATQQTGDKAINASNNSLKLSYFFAWVIVMLLFLLITRIALACARIGSELILFDMQIKKLAHTLAKEVNNNRH